MTTKRLFKNVLCMSTSFTPQKPEPPMARPGGPRSREALNAEGANHQAPCFSAKLALFVTGCAENGGNHPILGPSDSWPPSVCQIKDVLLCAEVSVLTNGSQRVGVPGLRL